MMQTSFAELLERARRLERAGQDEPAKAAYIELLKVDPCHFAALNELGTLALATGHRSAAQTAYTQAVRCHPDNPVGRVNLGNVLFESGELAAARDQYQAALACKADFPAAHQGLARSLEQMGQTLAAEPHWRLGFAGHAVVRQRYRGSGTAIPALLLVSTKPGNVPTRQILDDRMFETAAIYAEFYDAAEVLPPHVVVFNCIGDADLCRPGLQRAQALVSRSRAPVINAPARVLATGRAPNAQRLGRLPDVVAPLMRHVTREQLPQISDLKFPLLLRAPGFHTGQHFVRIETRAELNGALGQLPGEEILAIEYLNARAADGLARKYRVAIIDGALYPLHLAISSDWKVHYFTANMAQEQRLRDEEARFLADMPFVLGPRAMNALRQIAATLQLDYAGVDFALREDGALLLFESNANMAIVPPNADPIWDYRRPAIARVIEAAKRMIVARAGASHAAPP
jgi:tetratricopeptide (TPR) repeat protein